MKSRIIISIVTLVFNLNFVNAQIHKYAPDVVLIGIGEKNATFNESRYPDLKFYYTPELTIKTPGNRMNNAVVEGEPEFIQTIWNNKNFKNGFMLFDKNGVCAAMGYDIMRQKDIGARGCADKKSLNDHLKTYVKKGKTMKKSTKEMKLKKSNFFVGYEMPEFKVKNANGEAFSITSITKSGKPTLVIFFHIPANLDLNAGKKGDYSKSTGKSFFKAMIKGAKGAKNQRLFPELESEFFQYDARE